MHLLFCLAANVAPLLFIAATTVVGGDAQTSLPKGPAPRLFTVTAIDGDSCELREVGPTRDGLTGVSTFRPELRHLQITDAAGNKLSAQDFKSRVKAGTMVAVAADERPVDPAYTAVLKPETLVLHGVVVRVEGIPAVPVQSKARE